VLATLVLLSPGGHCVVYSPYRPAADAPRIGYEPHNAVSKHAFTRTAFPDQANNFTTSHLQIDIIGHDNIAKVSVKFHLQLLHFQQNIILCCVGHQNDR
jgi:hypothetical protein